MYAKTIPKAFPIPKAENICDDMDEADVFTVLDLKSAYWHIPINEGDKIINDLWYPMQSTSGEYCCLAQRMLRFHFHTSRSIFLRNFVVSQEVFMMIVSYSVNEQIIFIM